jgi:hypothetical protein
VSIQPAAWLNSRLQDLLKATLVKESATAARDAEIFVVQKRHNPAIEKSESQIASLTSQIEEFYRANCAEWELNGKKSVQLASGLIGLRAPTNPALIPLTEAWTWERISKRLKRLYKARFFHDPRPPAPDKVKIKRELDGEQLKKVGLKLDTEESFFVELNRLAVADEQKVAA